MINRGFILKTILIATILSINLREVALAQFIHPSGRHPAEYSGLSVGLSLGYGPYILTKDLNAKFKSTIGALMVSVNIGYKRIILNGIIYATDFKSKEDIIINNDLWPKNSNPNLNTFGITSGYRISIGKMFSVVPSIGIYYSKLSFENNTIPNIKPSVLRSDYAPALGIRLEKHFPSAKNSWGEGPIFIGIRYEFLDLKFSEFPGNQHSFALYIAFNHLFEK